MFASRALLPIVLAAAFSGASGVGAVACKGSSSSRPAPTSAAPQARGVDAGARPAILALRPYGIRVPKTYGASHPAPLVLALHQYGGSGPTFVDSWELDELAEKKGFILAFPNGTMEPTAARTRYWNATDACCDFHASGVDDVAYLGAVIDDVAARYAVDAKRVYVVGFSNGAFMAHRLACDLGGRIAAIVSEGGATWLDPTRCTEGSPVAVLEVHGSNDAVVPFAGGAIPFPNSAPVPSVQATALLSATKNGCTTTEEPTGTLDLDERIPGAETHRQRFKGCPSGSGVEVWTIEGGEHLAHFSDKWPEAMWTFLSQQHKS